MRTLARIGPVTSFVLCLLGGLVLLLNGVDKENGLLCGIGLFCIGMAFFVGPMLWVAIEKHRTKSDNK
jgi:hypothetical protein